MTSFPAAFGRHFCCPDDTAKAVPPMKMEATLYYGVGRIPVSL
jgi:hypothetical protein